LHDAQRRHRRPIPAPCARSGDANVVPLPRRERRVTHAGGGRGGRRPHQPSASFIVWPYRYWPRRSEDIDRANSWAWRLHCDGIIDAVDVAVREVEFRSMRAWLQ
jgi:hypothetical protein